jgi:small GTP-binding protein
MDKLRRALFIGLAIAVLGMVLTLVAMLLQLYSQIAFTSPFLANLVLTLLILLIGGVIGAGFYSYLRWGRSRQAPPKQPIKPTIPLKQEEAALKHLESLQQQVEQIHNTVARQALVDQYEAIATSMSQGAFQIVVFGVSSAGKTSIVNAILGRLADDVHPTFGTTTAPKTYKLRLRGVERQIWLIDTPGILEAGVAGTEREQQARQQAIDANLILFVIDSDLTQSEFQLLRSLLSIGKRLLLVFNKIDRYPTPERDQLLKHLGDRLATLLHADDILTTAAHPPAIPLEDGTLFQPEPNVISLLRRMATILRAEGESLIADNILLQTQRLTDEIRAELSTQRQQEATQLIERFQWMSAGVVAATPLPGVDLLAAAAVNTQMIMAIGKIYGCDLTLERAKDLAISLTKTLVSLGVLKGALELFSLALQSNVATFLIGRAIQGVTAAYLTRIAGKSFITYFQNAQSWGDGGITDVVQEQFQLNQRDEFIRQFVQEAIATVIHPLEQELASDLPMPPPPSNDHR